MRLWAQERLAHLEAQSDSDAIDLATAASDPEADPFFDPEGDPPPKKNYYDD